MPEPEDDGFWLDDFSGVMCPGQPKENFCDCTGDCFESDKTKEWCSCGLAQSCCSASGGDPMTVAVKK